MKIIVLGAGGVGGYLGARLLSSGVDVAFFVRDQRARQLDADGLVIRSPLGDVKSQVTSISSVNGVAAPDIIILACKAHSLPATISEIAPLVGSQTRILPLLNGIRHLDQLGQRFASAKVVGGLIHGALNLRDDGVIEHLSPFLKFIAGALTNKSDPVVEELVTALRDAGVDARVSDDIQQDMWNKFVFLTAFAGITCLMRSSVGPIAATDDGRRLVLQLLDECRAVAHSERHDPPEDNLKDYRELLLEQGSTFKSSMLRDIEGVSRTESDHIIGDMLKRAKANDVPVPLLSIAHVHLSVYERNLGLA